jgi:predicted transcriptional regulator
MTEHITQSELLQVSGDICSAYLSNNTMNAEEIPSLISKVYTALIEINRQSSLLRHHGPISPAVPIEESIKDDYIVCLEDGKKLQMLKRHLNTMYKMTVEQYRERWGLPADYPVVAPSYARRRSEIARNTGLGTTGRKPRGKVSVTNHGTNDQGYSQVAVMSKK